MDNHEKIVKFDEHQDFLSPWDLTDVVLVVEEYKFHVHKSTLSLWSPVFEKMFTLPFVERNADEVVLPGKRREEMEVLLRLMYSDGKIQQVDDDNYCFLLELSEEYQMDRVRELCSDFLKSAIEESNCLQICHVAERFQLKDVLAKCIEEARYRGSKSLLNDDDYEDLAPELKNEVCMERIKELERTLQEYTTACGRLVERVYHKTAERLLHEKTCDQLDDHRAFVTVSGGFVARSVPEFDVGCRCCTKRVEEADWNKVGTNFYVLKEYLPKLHALQRTNRVSTGLN